MSKILFQGNNLVVEGSVGEEYTKIPNENTCKRRHFMLRFIVQVNGGMVVFDHSFPILKYPQGGEIGSEAEFNIHSDSWQLEDWTEWNVIKNLFCAFKYKFSDEMLRAHTSDSHIILGWIDSVMQSTPSN